MWTGIGGWEFRRKGDGRCVWGGEGGVGRSRNYTTWHYILQLNKREAAGAPKIGWEPGLKSVGSVGSGNLKTPDPVSLLPSPPPSGLATKIR